MTAALLEPAARPLDYPNPQWPGGPTGPNPRQQLAHELAPHCDEMLFGGARGGGKTDFILAEVLRRVHLVPGMAAVIFRRTFKELQGPGGVIPRLLARIPRSVARYNASEHVWRFANGSTLNLSYLETLSDVQAWLGLELQLMVFDQVEQLDEDVYELVRTSLRASGDIAAGMTAAGYHPSSISTANPGGRGHGWVKARFVDPFPLGGQLFRAPPSEGEPEPSVRVFVPSKLSDNEALERGDPGYRRRLERLDPVERAAQLEGDWSVYKGARFAAFRTDIHVRELEVPEGGGVARACGIDYGSENPFVALWAVTLADGLVYVYREVAGRGLSPAEQAAAVLDAEAAGERTPQRPVPTALDPACWAAPPDKPLRRTGGKTVRPSGPPPGSIADTYRRNGLPVRRADNRRVEGWAELAGRLTVRPDGLPRLVISPLCVDLIRTLPALQRSPRNPEDVVKSSDDHWADALRYLLMLLRDLNPPAAGMPDRGGRTIAAGNPPGMLPPALRGRPGAGLRRRPM